MSARRYLPSAQFTLIIVSVCTSGGLVWAANLFTEAHPAPEVRVDTGEQSLAVLAAQKNWEATLYAIQAGQASSLLPEAPNQNTVEALREAAQTTNVTATVGRTLLVDLTNAKAQGLGDDIPTQNQLIQSAAAHIGQSAPTRIYHQSDLALAADSATAMHTYGNALAVVLIKDSKHNYADTLTIVDNAIAQGDASLLKKLEPVAAAYKVLVADLLVVPVPKTLAPFHLALVNDFEQSVEAYPSIEVALSDPLRGLTALQTYKSLSEQELQMLINIARAFDKNGILFKTDEPGALWGLLLSAQQ